MVTETSGTRTGTLDSEYENIGIIPIYFVFHCPLGLCCLTSRSSILVRTHVLHLFLSFFWHKNLTIKNGMCLLSMTGSHATVT